MDFAALTSSFFDSAMIAPAKHGRLLAIGELQGIITVVFTTLGSEAVAVISMRPASSKERKAYEQAL